MKLSIINGENGGEKIQIEINEDSIVKHIKYKLDEILHGNEYFTRFYFRLIHKNTILLDNNSMKGYHLCENDEIWFGKIENYLKKDDVIIDTIYVRQVGGVQYFIVKMNDKISTIRSIIERIQYKIIDIWNLEGKQMKDDQFVTEIDVNGNYRLIICFESKENEAIYTFNEYCHLHDIQMVDRYLLFDEIRHDNKNELVRFILMSRMIKIRQIISSNDNIDDRLKQNLSDLPPSFLNSKFFFCYGMTDYIFDICNDYWLFVINHYEDDVVKVFEQYFYYAILAALWDYCAFRQHKKNVKNKLIRNIVIDALDYFLIYLIDSDNDWEYWLKLFTSQFLLRPINSSFVTKRITNSNTNKFRINLRINGKFSFKFIAYKPETILDAKKSISDLLKVNMQHLYCIKPGGDRQPNDEDPFNDEFIIEIVLSINDIEILSLLGQGASGEVMLCRDKISNDQYALKKPKTTEISLCRDINIQCQTRNCDNILNYSRLIKDDENICMAVKYMPGESLAAYLKKTQHLKEKEIIKISYSVLTQINELHQSGIIHRDIKPDNIVLDENSNAKLIDFGLAKCVIGLVEPILSENLNQYVPGTIYYMAPELLKKLEYSYKIDIWSFGMVMVEMVTGKHPFYPLKPLQTVLPIKNCTKYVVEPVVSISNEFLQFINQCLNINPNERPSAHELLTLDIFK